MMTNKPIQFAAYIENVKEVALFGKADLAFWRERLNQERFFPYNDGGKAGILISVPHLLWKGARFNELSISLAISEQEDGGTPDGFFLPYAVNSNRFLAFMERVFFQTPYHYADIQVLEQMPVQFAVKHGTETVCEGKMSGKRDPARREVEHFEGPVHLPGGKYFLARISGMTDFYPFSETDVLAVNGTRATAFEWLRESNFTPIEWRIRGNAVHGKSKTYLR
ncbi:MAG: hypothetical protein Fur0022_14180 [Anaerolineales bacterium]